MNFWNEQVLQWVTREFHFSMLIFNNSATNKFLEVFFLWISHVTSLNCIVLLFKLNIDLKLRLSTFFFSTNLREIRHKYLTSYIAMVSWCIVCKGFPAPLFKAPTPWPNLPPSPFLKSLCPLSSVLFHPLLRYFRQFSPSSHKSLLP